MAGSWGHIVTKSGTFQGARLIENLGDAYEALEECYGMVQWLAERLDQRDEGFVTRQEWVGRAVVHYEEGLNLGGVAAKRFFGE